MLKGMILAGSMVMAALVGGACGGGGPCAKSVEATGKYGPPDEKKMVEGNKDNFIKACEMGLKQSPDMAKMLECQGNATDEKSFNDCRKM